MGEDWGVGGGDQAACEGGVRLLEKASRGGIPKRKPNGGASRGVKENVSTA